MDDVDLPALPLMPQTLLPALSRKRIRSEYHDAETSSDPAYFSNDEQAPSAEVYSLKRRKEQWEGTWWSQHLQKRENKPIGKRAFKRNFDSGVFMGSDSTSTSLDDELLQDQQRDEDRARDSRHTDIHRTRLPLRVIPSIPAEKLPTASTTSPAHGEARAIIQNCLESGAEDVNLSTLGLETLPSDLAALNSLTRHRHMPDKPASERYAYQPIQPDLRLYLGVNGLSRLPAMLFDFKNLCLLSLRQNNLSALPPAICRLERLQTLNVSGNNLTHLPFEILHLIDAFQLRDLVVMPNPFATPPQPLPQHPDANADNDDISIATTTTGSQPHPAPPLLSLRVDGHGCLDKLAVGAHVYARANGSRQPDVPPTAGSAVPSLTEMVLSGLLKNPAMLRLAHTSVGAAVTDNGDSVDDGDDGHEDEHPASVHAGLAAAQAVHDSGGQWCHRCGRAVVLPRQEWLEWWRVPLGSGRSYSASAMATTTGSISSSRMAAAVAPPNVAVLPFRRLVCSAACRGAMDR